MPGRGSDRFEMIGRTGNFYWVEKLHNQKIKNSKGLKSFVEEQSFNLLDERLNFRNGWTVFTVPGVQKQWLISGENGLDQVLLISVSGKTKILCNHFSTDEKTEIQSRLVDSLPFSTNPSAFLLVRSEDLTKILLVAFDNADPEYTRLHVILWDNAFRQIYHHLLSHRLLSQPCIQDDEIGYPSESFDNLPIKLANSGEWLMAAPSRLSHNFSVFHVLDNGNELVPLEIPVSPYYHMEDIAMSIDNEKQEMDLGILSGYPNTSLKNVETFSYSLSEGRIKFDTSYHFNTQSKDIRNKNLCHTRFMAVPDKGYLLMNEFGSPFDFNRPSIPVLNESEATYLMANYSIPSEENKNARDGYRRERGLSPTLQKNPGDLSLYYFPVVSKDSLWTGQLDIEQHTAINNPDLSYLTVPVNNRLYILYNTPDGFADPLATTTLLNIKGQIMDNGLVFWKVNRSLDFQKSRRFSADEIAIPFNRQAEAGFAVIRLHSPEP